jgi:hypothetical protein
MTTYPEMPPIGHNKKWAVTRTAHSPICKKRLETVFGYAGRCYRVETVCIG